ncbi:hypothetical protein H2204_002429 [Knufia peltigerae]|uniref:Uncharacterized protein n=1 Tax=Knufia peltigerae TaxID=1002370 RepID=A0AA38YBG9_9EURO|nr:hypothetical protein H2204_002429 [Knufia peltigerae]
MPLSMSAPTLPSIEPVAALLNDFRTTLRILNLLRLYELLRSLILRETDTDLDRFTRTVLVAQACSYLNFQVMESIMHLTDKQILPSSIVLRRGGPDAWMRWAFRSWLLAVSLDFVRLGWDAMKHRRPTMGSTTIADRDSFAGVKEEIDHTWWAELQSSVAWLPVSLHLSLPHGLPGMNDGLMSLSSLLAEWPLCKAAWDATS